MRNPHTLLIIPIAILAFRCSTDTDGVDSTISDTPIDALVDVSDVSDDAGFTPVHACDQNDDNPAGPACTSLISTSDRFDRFSIGPTGVQYWDRATKYMVPASDDPNLIPPLVQNANRYPIHMDFLEELFFPGLTMSAYADLVTKRATRKYYTGNLIRIDHPEYGVSYAFTVYTAPRTDEQLEPSEIRTIYGQVSKMVTAGPVAYTFEPSDGLGPTRARAWIDPGFPIIFPSGGNVDVEVYTPGAGCGTVRVLTMEQFDSAVAAGTLSYRDIPVIEAVPFDIEPVVAAVVTGGRQWELSHVNVRMGRRGTPNLFVRDAVAEFAEWNGRLVKLESTSGTDGNPDTYSIQEIGQDEAELWWAEHRPSIDDVPAPDSTYFRMDSLTEMDIDDEPVPLIQRFGGKTANLAKLYGIIDADFQVPGFGIPFAYFERFVDENSILDGRISPPETVSLRQYVQRLADDPAVSADAGYRHVLLTELRDHIRDGCSVPPDDINALVTRIIEIFGAPDVPVRFRSSSNVEDSLEFSGAGLYESTTACAADQTDGDTAGPSRCNAAQPEERTIERALLKVWASLFGNRAWDERDWYQIDQTAASMAILVSQGFPDEAANGVAFTGDPADPADRRYVINAQVGDEKVVSNDPSKVPELDRLEITDGQVSWIERERSSTLAKPGIPVLSDETLKTLGALMAAIDREYPVQTGNHRREDILLDMEFKVEKGTGSLKLKQIRPFLQNTDTEASE